MAVFVVDNFQTHRVSKTRIARLELDGLPSRGVLVLLQTYSPELQPAERLWRQWRPNVTHHHTRESMAALQEGSDVWLARMAAQRAAVLQAAGLVRPQQI